MTSRRIFLSTIPAAALTLGVGKTAFARAETLSESDPAAVALGYKADASKVDARSGPPTPPDACARIASCMPASRATRWRRALSSEASWSTPRDGAPPGSRRPDGQHRPRHPPRFSVGQRHPPRLRTWPCIVLHSRRQFRQHRPVERRQIVRLAAGDQAAVDDDFFIGPLGAGVAQVGLQAGPACHMF